MTTVHIVLDTDSWSDLSLISRYMIVESLSSLVNSIVGVSNWLWNPFQSIYEYQKYKDATNNNDRFSQVLSFNVIFVMVKFRLSSWIFRLYLQWWYLNLREYYIGSQHWSFYIIISNKMNITISFRTCLNKNKCYLNMEQPVVLSISVSFPWHPLTWSQSDLLQSHSFWQC